MKLQILLLLSVCFAPSIHTMDADAAEVLACAVMEHEREQKLLKETQKFLSEHKLSKNDSTDHDDICDAFRKRDLNAIQEFMQRSKDLTTPIIYSHQGDLKITSLIDLAAQHSLPDVIAQLRGRDVDVDQKDDECLTPLARALTHGVSDCETLLFLVTEKSITSQDRKGRGPLHIIMCQRKVHLNVIDLLIGQGALINQPDAKGNTPIHYAAGKDSSGKILGSMLKTIKDEDTLVDLISLENVEGNTPLHLAMERYIDGKDNADLIDSIKCLLDLGASMLHPNSNGISPMDLVFILSTQTDDTRAATRAQKLKEFLDDYFQDSIWEKLTRLF